MEDIKEAVSSQGVGGFMGAPRVAKPAPGAAASAMSSWFLSGSAPDFRHPQGNTTPPSASIPKGTSSANSAAAATLSSVAAEPEVAAALAASAKPASPAPLPAQDVNGLLQQLRSGLAAEHAAADAAAGAVVGAVKASARQDP